MKRRALTQAELAAARRLQEIWDQKRVELDITQEEFAHRCGWQTQGAFSQYLLGKIPLNLKALLKISAELKVFPDEIYPELAALLSKTLSISTVRGRQHGLTTNEDTLSPVASGTPGGAPELAPKQAILLNHFEALTEEQQGELLRELEETKQRNEAIFEALSRKKAEKGAKV
jgi:transcriptional regulator with XRE-family HTH domain